MSVCVCVCAVPVVKLTFQKERHFVVLYVQPNCQVRYVRRCCIAIVCVRGGSYTLPLTGYQ